MHDEVVVGVTYDGSFRVMAAHMSETCRTIAQAQGVQATEAMHLGELVTATTLFRVTMAPKYRVQGILKATNQTGHYVADAHPEGWCRGLVSRRDASIPLTLGKGSLLQMMRTLPRGELQQGVVELDADSSISGALVAYLSTSEQVVSSADVVCGIDSHGNVVRAAGYIVQLLPEAPEQALAIMTARLETDFQDLSSRLAVWDGSAEVLLGEILYGMPYEITSRNPIRYECNCSRVRVLASLGTLGKPDILELTQSGKPLEIGCDYCGADYVIRPAELRGLLESS
ncbi:MAG: Hsp33 family molecular chaperone HslO [Myxococcota bacterium]